MNIDYDKSYEVISIHFYEQLVRIEVDCKKYKSGIKDEDRIKINLRLEKVDFAYFFEETKKEELNVMEMWGKELWLKKRTIGELINYWQKILNTSSNNKEKKVAYLNLKRLRGYFQKDLKNEVFIVNDKVFDGPNKLGRRVVVVEQKKNKLKVIPVYLNKRTVHLEKFDGKRFLDIKDIKDVELEKLYEKRDFKNTINDYLTDNDIDRLNYLLNLK